MKTQTTERPKQITVKVTGVIIGDRKFQHDISIPNPKSDDAKPRRKEIEGVALTWLTHQYPTQAKSLADVRVDIPDEEVKKESPKQK